MGVGYQVSALHRLVRLETRELDTRSVERGENPVLDAISDASGRDVRVAKGPLRTRSPTIDSVLLDPSVKQTVESDESKSSLAAAWWTSATVLRLAIIAAHRHLPLWTTG
jgi:hypothetical protein